MSAWVDLYATALIDLGLTDTAFWSATPAALDAMARRAERGEHAKWRRAAMICTVIANANRNPKHKPTPYRESDFISPLPQPRRKKRQSVEQMIAMAAQANRALGGKDLRSNADA